MLIDHIVDTFFAFIVVINVRLRIGRQNENWKMIYRVVLLFEQQEEEDQQRSFHNRGKS